MGGTARMRLRVSARGMCGERVSAMAWGGAMFGILRSWNGLLGMITVSGRRAYWKPDVQYYSLVTSTDGDMMYVIRSLQEIYTYVPYVMKWRGRKGNTAQILLRCSKSHYHVPAT